MDISLRQTNFDSIISYSSIQFVYLVLEIVDCIFNLQDHCFVCGASIPPLTRPSVCMNLNCARLLFAGLNFVCKIRRDWKAADLLVNSNGTGTLESAPQLQLKNGK